MDPTQRRITQRGPATGVTRMDSMVDEVTVTRVDTFVGPDCQGNRAAVCLIDDIDDSTRLRAIAGRAEAAVTAFIEPVNRRYYRVRWLSPAGEIRFCGHGALAAGHVLYHSQIYTEEPIELEANELLISLFANRGEIGFATSRMATEPAAMPAFAGRCLQPAPDEAATAGGGDDYWVFYWSTPGALRSLAPRFDEICNATRRAIIATAPSDEPDYDYQVRYFAPQYGFAEDSVTGSGNAVVADFWASRTGEHSFRVHQVSPAGGDLQVRCTEHTVFVQGATRTVDLRSLHCDDPAAKPDGANDAPQN